MDHKRVTQIGLEPDPKLKPLFLAEPGRHLITGRDRSLELNRQQLDPRPLKRKLSVSGDPLSFKPKQGSQVPTKRQQQVKQAHVHYHEFLRLEQAGPATIGSSNTSDCHLVAIKRSKVTKTPPPRFVDFTCDNVVKLKDFQLDGNEVRMIYEQMDVSLRVLNGMPNREWEGYEIGAVCKEVCWKLPSHAWTDIPSRCWRALRSYMTPTCATVASIAAQ